MPFSCHAQTKIRELSDIFRNSKLLSAYASRIVLELSVCLRLACQLHSISAKKMSKLTRIHENWLHNVCVVKSMTDFYWFFRVIIDLFICTLFLILLQPQLSQESTDDVKAENGSNEG